MCLVVLAWQVLPEHPLVVAANRDEFHGRPAAQAAFWRDQPSILAGRDLQAHGTWMGVSRTGRFAAVTNYRGARELSAPESRGALVTGFLLHAGPAADFIFDLKKRMDAYSGFNLLACDGAELWSISNRGGAPRRLAPGIYGLGNTLLDAPEVTPIKAAFESAIRPSPAVETLLERVAAARIVNPEYGTRCSTVLIRTKHQTCYAERKFSPAGAEQETVRYRF